MKIRTCEFKGTKAIEMENDQIKVVILPEIGGKIASFYHKHKQFELLYQNKYDVYKKANTYDVFSEYDASGFDDCFPSIDAETVYYGDQEVKYPDHGEIWSAAFDYVIEDNHIKMAFTSTILPYQFEKVIRVEGYSLLIDYTITNHGNSILYGLWAMHCLIHCKEDMLIQFPENTKEIINVSPSTILGDVGTIHPYPMTETLKGEKYPLNKVCPKSANKCEKYYIKDQITEGTCGVFYPEDDVRYTVKFDKEKLPYIGFWITEGGFRGDYNCALEPTNGYYDSVKTAKTYDRLLALKPQQSVTFDIALSLE
ncbi:DUF5107 domain-containing protein [Vallitalea pronyensis]|uniref:DUF5107 domain-containing protein n=1 Tax=Vallitalea pronyensis TaxID=1348613 RepID=A0A8J8MN04_9FIRM|nr:DUF5107 domain-containing protein [Vallitalea pronyensis]QUI24489.1 DUF5107 domain-containing protein [Vallitalea pronyensis]